MWIDGTPISANNWAPGEPNSLGSERYVHIHPSSHPTGPTWNNGKGSHQGYLLELLPSDTDGDGVPDSLEITEGTDPNDENDFNEFSSGIVAWFPFTDSVENMAGTSVSASNNNAQLSYSEELQSPILSYGFNQWMEISGLGDYISGDPVTISGYYKYGSGVNHPREWGSGFKALMYSNTLPDGTNPQFRINVSGSP